MGASFKKSGGKFYVESEEEIDIGDVLGEIELDIIMNHFDHSEILEQINDKTIVDYVIDNQLLSTSQCVDAVDDMDELRVAVARKIVGDD